MKWLTSLIFAIYHRAVVSYVWPPSSSGEPAPLAYAVIRERTKGTFSLLWTCFSGLRPLPEAVPPKR